MKKFKTALIVVAVLSIPYSIFITLLYFNILPIPLNDTGHRAFPVKDDHALVVCQNIFAKHGLKEYLTFKDGPTQQTLSKDNKTVLIKFDSTLISQELDLPTVSLVCDGDPYVSAEETRRYLLSENYTVGVIPISKDLVVLRSNCFTGASGKSQWLMVFRKHALAMGLPKNTFRITKE